MQQESLAGVAAIVFSAVTLVVLGDAAGKLLAGMGVNPLIVAWSRFSIAAILFLPFSGLKIRELAIFRDWRVLLRATFVVCAISCMLTALKTDEIANVYAAFFVGPIVSTILAIIFLHERPSLLRIALLAFGFLGVMLVVKPGFSMSFGLSIALLAGCCYGAYLTMTKLAARSKTIAYYERAEFGHFYSRFSLNRLAIRLKSRVKLAQISTLS